jgi:hypothetical protein
MAEDLQQEPLTEAEMAELARKLKSLGNDLTPKEGRFLTEVLQSGISMSKVSEIQGYTMQTALQGETMYHPTSYTPPTGTSQTMANSSDVRVSIAVVGHFNAP